MKVSVVVVEDDEFLREAICVQLAECTEITILGRLQDSIGLADLFVVSDPAHRVTPDVVVMDVWPKAQSSSSFRIPDSVETFTFLYAAGIRMKALFLTSLPRDYVAAACYALSSNYWDYLNKSQLTKKGLLAKTIIELATR